MTRFGEISPLRQDVKKLWPFRKGSFSFWQNFELTLVNFIYFGKFSSLHIICGQSYKASTIVNYDSRVVIWGIFKSGMTLES